MSATPPAGSGPRGAVAQTGLLLGRVSHPRRAILTAAFLALAAAVSGRAPREIGLVALTVLLGQAVLGWHNDLVDRGRDREAVAVDLASDGPSQVKPLAAGAVTAGNAWFAVACAVLLLVPLSLTNGVTAGSWYLASIGVGLLGNVLLRRSWLSFLPWATAFAAYPAFLSYGGWGGAPDGGPPQLALVVLVALLGVGVHVLGALPDLVVDNHVGYRHLALRIALRTGATRAARARVPVDGGGDGRHRGGGVRRRSARLIPPESQARASSGREPGTTMVSPSGVPTREGTLMLIRRNLALVLGTVALSAPALVACGFDAATDRPYTPAAGVYDQTTALDVSAAVIVSTEPGLGQLRRDDLQRGAGRGRRAHLARPRVGRDDRGRRVRGRPGPGRRSTSTWPTRAASR